MKIGLITLFGYTNYGNKLQNYAVQSLLERRGHTVDTIVYYPDYYKRLLINSYKIILGGLKVLRYRRFFNFYIFSKTNLHLRYVSGKKSLSKISSEYDLFMVGSDQVWNPHLRKNQRDFYFLQFTDQEKRACISPSFGISEIPEIYKNELRCLISTFSVLSSREIEGVSIIRDLTQHDAWHLIDPTLALNKTDWISIAKGIELPDKPYILKAFLGKETIQREIEITDIANKKNWIIIDLFNCYGKYYNIAPDQFLTLLNGAELICTDSFHCSAFAINFNRPFYSYRRLDKNGNDDGTFSRLATLLSEFKIEQSQGVLFSNLNYDKINKILEIKRQYFQQYLDLILKEDN